MNSETTKAGILETLKIAVSNLPKGKGGRPNGNACNKLYDAAVVDLQSIGVSRREAAILAHAVVRNIRWPLSGNAK